MKGLFIATSIIVSSMLGVGATLYKDNEKQPMVTKAVAPTVYPIVAGTGKIEGKVIVEVLVDSAGNIVRVHAVEGHRLLSQAALDAAARWKFAPNAQGKAYLIFIFRLVSDIKGSESSFSPPYQVELADKPRGCVQ